MKISKETWKDILKIVGTIIATIASVLGGAGDAAVETVLQN